ncbi:MAG: hypothetical protein H8E86_03690, partial [Planctomycetes bacterium]|nr:hypothetical protein [Planctomycetota bacterium]
GFVEYRFTGEVVISTQYEAGDPLVFTFVMDSTAEGIPSSHGMKYPFTISHHLIVGQDTYEFPLSFSGISPKLELRNNQILNTGLPPVDMFSVTGPVYFYYLGSEVTHPETYGEFNDFPIQLLMCFPEDTFEELELQLYTPILLPMEPASFWNGFYIGEWIRGKFYSLEITFYPAPTDVNEDNSINVQDLLAVIAAFGACDDCCEDVIQDGMVDITDLLSVLSDVDFDP